MNIEHIKVEPEFPDDEFETYVSEKEELNSKRINIRKIEKYENQSGYDEKNNEELLHLTKVEAYYENDDQSSCGDVTFKTKFTKTELNYNSDECDSFKISYIDENSHTPHSEFVDEDVTEEITIIGCDPVDTPIIDISQERKESSRTVPNILWFKCNICQFKTSKQLLYDKHVNMHVGIGTFKMFKCHLCAFKSIYPANLKKHLLRHEDSTVFYCDQCPYRANLKDALHDHVRNVHSRKCTNEERLYRCSYCEYKTKYVSNYKRHEKSCHENLLVCKFCDFRTNFRHKFVEHSISHEKVAQSTVFHRDSHNHEPDQSSIITNQKSIHKLQSSNRKFEVIRANNLKVFKCQECGHATTDQSNLNRHMKRHAKKGRVPLFECYFCGLKTKYKLNLVKHIKNHKIGSEGMF